MKKKVNFMSYIAIEDDYGYKLFRENDLQFEHVLTACVPLDFIANMINWNQMLIIDEHRDSYYCKEISYKKALKKTIKKLTTLHKNPVVEFEEMIPYMTKEKFPKNIIKDPDYINDFLNNPNLVQDLETIHDNLNLN
ncbi:hypothetical protein D9V86_06265 [Bacteroidetes/Chlorobi group bacterium ChocPot_Mid]|nr:MAG: hypothetical protein D9V86_06265 [Bacteroidetes/Chlorobi group bacterium ChocPot_Mid]